MYRKTLLGYYLIYKCSLIFGEVGDIIYGRIKYLPDISEAEEVVDV